MRILLAVCLLFAVICGSAVTVYASKTDLITVAADAQKKDPTIIINQGTAEIIDVDGPVADIMVADPALIEVLALKSSRLYIVGLQLGNTNLIALDEEGNIIKRLNVHVTIDTENIQRVIDDLFPQEDVSISALRGQIILTGSVSTPDAAQRIQNLVAQHVSEVGGGAAIADEALVNLMTVRGKAQVMLRVKVMEVARTLLKERGTDTDIGDLGDVLGDDVQTNPNFSNLLGGVVQTGITETPFASFGLLESIGAFGPIETILTLLEENGLAKVLAEPNLTAISGEEAGFLAGGEFPVPAGRDDDGNIIIEFRQFGVSLSFAPVVMSEDRISMQLETEVSSLARESAATLAGIEVPGLDVRRASTTVEMASGKTLMIAGLLQSQTFKNLSGIPGMVNSPIIGALMGSESFRRDESEMVVLVTPYLVEPYGDKMQAKKVPANEKPNGLAMAFSRNIRRTYGDLKISDLFEGEQSFGYIIE